MKSWKIIADNLRKTGWNCGCVSAVHSDGRTFFIAYVYHDGSKPLVVRADEKLTAFMELESASRRGS